MNLDNLDKILTNEPKYRAAQISGAVFKNLIDNWNSVLNLPLKLREKLEKVCPLEINGEIKENDENNNATKVVINFRDGLKIETVLMKHNIDNFSEEGGGRRNTVCVSSQVGCPLKCEFCATGKMGFKRNLTKWEIVEQVLFFARFLKKQNERITNIVFMGMGEPFLNYKNVISAIKILNSENGLNIAARKISVSTCGIIPGIEKFTEENLQINLAISLHAPSDALRSRLMPINKKYPLAEVIKAVQKYVKKTSRKVMFEYVLLKGINDSENCAYDLAKLMNNNLYFVNLIFYNSTGVKNIQSSSLETIKKFKKILEKAGVQVSERYRFGRSIKAACGQLALNAII